MEYFQKNKVLRNIAYKFARHRAEQIFTSIKPFLNEEKTILDIGSGSCNIVEILNENNYNVTPLDIANLSLIEDIKPIIYNGGNMPFKDKTFDTSIILTVLHHTDKQKEIIAEAMRVTRNKIVVMEDIHVNQMDKYITQFVDSLINLEIRGHPHSNKNDSEWKDFFQRLGLKIIDVKYPKRYLVFKPAIYELGIK